MLLPGLPELALDVPVTDPAPQGALARSVVLVTVADDPRFQLLPTGPHGACVDEPDRAVCGVYPCAEQEPGEHVDPGRCTVVLALRAPPASAVHLPKQPAVLIPQAAARGRSREQCVEHHLLVIPANDGGEARGRFRSGDPVLGVERPRSAVDQVPGAEDSVVLAHLERGERVAQRREVPVHVPDYGVAAALVALEAWAEVRVWRREGVHSHRTAPEEAGIMVKAEGTPAVRRALPSLVRFRRTSTVRCPCLVDGSPEPSGRDPPQSVVDVTAIPIRRAGLVRFDAG